MKQDFKCLPIIASLRWQSEAKYSGDNISNKQLVVLMILSVNQRCKDSPGIR